MDTAGWLQMLVPSGVAALAAFLVWQASKRADKTQRDSIRVDIRRIEADLRNQCVVELHRQKIAACLGLAQSVARVMNHIDRNAAPETESFAGTTYALLAELNEAGMRGTILLDVKASSEFGNYLSALYAWLNVSLVDGEEKKLCFRAAVALAKALREELGVQALPVDMFRVLLSKSDAKTSEVGLDL